MVDLFENIGDRTTLKFKFSYSKVKGGEEKLGKYEQVVKDYIINFLLEDGQVIQYLERHYDKLKVKIEEKKDHYISYIYTPSPEKKRVGSFIFKIESGELQLIQKNLNKKKLFENEKYILPKSSSSVSI